MIKAMPISEMRKFCFGAKIVCSDGEEGSLTSIGFDGANRLLLAIGIRIGRFFGKTVYVSFTHVVDAIASGITLDITSEQLLAASKEALAAAWLDSRSVVVNTDTSARGTLMLIAVHPDSGELAYVVAHHLRQGQSTLLREDAVTKIDADQITVSLAETTLQTLPPYRTDEELQADVETVLFSLTPLHVDFRGIMRRVVDGVLYLDGNISSSLRGDIVEDQAVGVQGLLGVENHLIGDDVLANTIASVLGHDPRTRDLPIGVYPRLGTVRLGGAVHDEQQKAVAEDITRGIPGVQSVENTLVVKSDSNILNVMAAASGGESQDLIPGRYTRHTK
jgi:osmotically-inducible protein OsmY